MNLGRFILILKITNQFLCKYIYIFETYITCKAGDIYFLKKIDLSVSHMYDIVLKFTDSEILIALDFLAGSPRDHCHMS